MQKHLTLYLHINEIRFQYWWHSSFNVVQFYLRSIQSDFDQPVDKEAGNKNIQLMDKDDTMEKVPTKILRTNFFPYKKESRPSISSQI